MIHFLSVFIIFILSLLFNSCSNISQKELKNLLAAEMYKGYVEGCTHVNYMMYMTQYQTKTVPIGVANQVNLMCNHLAQERFLK